MKIKTLSAVKIAGKFYAAGKFVEVKEADVKKHLKAKLVEAVKEKGEKEAEKEAEKGKA